MPNFSDILKKSKAPLDAGGIVRAVQKAKPSVAMRQGFLVRKIARNSLRRSKKPSMPGNPPHVHAGKDQKNLKDIHFAADGDEVVIGPMKFNQVFFKGDRKPVSGTVPGTLERGGEIGILEVFKYKRWQRADLRSKRRLAELPLRLRMAKIAARPFMAPALKKSIPMLAKAWAGKVRRAA